MLSACGSDNGANTRTRTEPDGSLDKCTIRFSWWGGDDRHEATLEAIELWNELHPDITVKAEYGGWDGWTEKINAQISGNTAPDLMQINYDWLINLSPDGEGFYDLNKLHDTLDLSGYDAETLSFGEVNGHLNAVTVSMSGRGLFYNSEVYEEVGASYPRTWEELLALGNTFGSKGLYPLDLDIQSGGTAWYLSVVYIQQTTGRQFITMDGRLGFTADDIKMALDFYKSLEENHVIRNVQTRTDEDGNAALYQSSEFINGNVAGVLEWGSAIGKYESVLDSGVLESGPFLSDGSGNSKGWLIKPSLLYAISSDTEYPDETAAFMDFLLNNAECAEILGTSRGIPASQYAFDHLNQSGMLTGLSYESTVMLDELDTVTISPYMELPRMKEFYNTAIEKVSYSAADTSEAAQEMYDSITAYLETFK
ncbi:MAG: carbohydrate ABC transporter substrate-binding protein [Ruminococcus sp.]|nr:carbohydrate ABC transporter substrate-binding protein [Ruminococcus sp.]